MWSAHNCVGTLLPAMVEMATSELREVVLRFAQDPGWARARSIAVTEAVVAELPDVADDDFRDALQASVESNIRLLVEMLVGGLDPAEATPPPAAVEYAREFVRRGMSIDSLLRAYFIGHAAFLQGWIDQLHADVEDPVARGRMIEEGATWTFAFIQALTRGIVERYAGERERWVRSAAAVRAETVRALLEGERLDAEAAAGRLRYQLDRGHLAFVVWGGGGDQATPSDPAALEGVAADIACSLGFRNPLLVAQGANLVTGWLGSREPFDEAMLSGMSIPAVEVPGVCAAFGAPGHGIPGFRASHRQALHARRVAILRGGSSGSVTAYHDVALAALASADVDHARDFVLSELGPLAGDDDQARRLSETLLVYLEENASPRRTAHRLGVHENTIANRVRAAQELLQRPIEHRVAELLVALRLTPLTHQTPEGE